MKKIIERVIDDLDNLDKLIKDKDLLNDNKIINDKALLSKSDNNTDDSRDKSKLEENKGKESDISQIKKDGGFLSLFTLKMSETIKDDLKTVLLSKDGSDIWSFDKRLEDIDYSETIKQKHPKSKNKIKIKKKIVKKLNIICC